MVPAGTGIPWKLQNNPEELTDEELTNTSLSALSKSLGTLNSRRIINVYLRWLEVQRKAPRRNINYHFLNTIAHWTQALRKRGFTLEEIDREVSAWKAVNGPFIDASSPGSEARLPPTSANLSFGWDRAPTTTKAFSHDENMSGTTSDMIARRYDTQLERKLNCPLTKVPASYICNRCKGRGHYVSDCPTNENPAYDIAAGYDYICKFCKERGTHYFMFCAQNPDPNSVFRRRQRKAFQSLQGSPSRGDLGLKKTFDSAPESPESTGPVTPPRSKILVPQVHIPTTEFDLFANRKRTSSRDGFTGSLKHDDDFGRVGIGMNSFAMGGPWDSDRSVKSKESNLGGFETMESSDVDMVWERLANDIQRKHAKGLQKQSKTSSQQLVNEKTTDSTTTTAINQPSHADFLSKLFVKFPSERNPKWRPRMTALEMWDINDTKKLEEDYEEETAKMSLREPSVGLKSPNYDERNLTRYSESNREDSIDVDDDDYSKASEQDIDFLIDTRGFEEYENHQEEQEDLPTHEEKVRAIQKKIDSIEGLRTRLASDGDIDFPEMKQMTSRNLSQDNLDEISCRIRAPEPSSPSGLTSSSSELSSPPRLSSSTSKRGKGVFRTY